MTTASSVPSGIKRGTARTAFFQETGLPMPEYLMPVIESGTYEDFKACVFSVLALQIFENMVDDICADLERCGLRMIQHGTYHKWVYVQNVPDQDSPAMTEVELRFQSNQDSSNLKIILDTLGVRYGFRLSKLTVDHRLERRNMGLGLGPGEMYFVVPRAAEVEVRLLFYSWQ